MPGDNTISDYNNKYESSCEIEFGAHFLIPENNQVIAMYQVDQGPVDVVAVQDELWVMSEGSVWRIQPQG
ncbi:MAG TPA: hypothetical protein VFZ76_15135 [Anaerolineales bacterium]